MNYKGFDIVRSENPFYGKFYFIYRDNCQYWPSDVDCPTSIVECKILINNFIKKYESKS